MQKKSWNSKGESWAMETHFYTMELFFSFTNFFPWTFRKMPRWYFSITECKKKSRNSRGKSRAMETHFYTMELFFSFTEFFPWTFRKIPYYSFLCPNSISWLIIAKKISKFEREVKSNGNTLLPTRFFLWTLRKIPYYLF